MATSYKIRLKRFNGTDYDTLNLISDNIIMSSGNNLQTDYNNLDGAIDDIVYVGNDAPTDPNTKIWLDTDASGASAVNSVNGKAGTVVLDADDVGATTPWITVWENASPLSNFSNQTITLDLSEYEEAMVEYQVYANATNNAFFLIFRIPCQSYPAYIGINSSGANYGFQRPTQFSTGSVVFGTATEKQLGATGNATQVTNRMVPIRIYAR